MKNIEVIKRITESDLFSKNADNIGKALLLDGILENVNFDGLLERKTFNVKSSLDVSFKDKVIIVTGGAGFIGSEICRQVLKSGCKRLLIFDSNEYGLFLLNERLKSEFDTNLYSVVLGNIREENKLKEVFNKFFPQIIIHAAAYKHIPMMEDCICEAVKNNVLGTKNVINAGLNAGAERFILISTDKAVNPSSVMGASKRVAEMLVQTAGESHSMKMAAVRFGNVLGSGGSVMPIFLRRIINGEPITLTDRNVKRYFMTVFEAAQLVLQAGMLADSGEVFLLDMGEPIYVYDLACGLIKLLGLEPNKDVKIITTGLRAGEKLFEQLRYDDEVTKRTVKEKIFVTKLNKVGDGFEKKLDSLINAAKKEDVEETKNILFGIVPRRI